MSATFWSLLFNGFVGFQLIEDGSPLSVWVGFPHYNGSHEETYILQSLRISSMVVFAASYTISIGTFLGRVGLSKQSPMALFVLYFGFNGLCALLFVCLQVGLVLTTLEDRWPLGILMFLHEHMADLLNNPSSKKNSGPRLWVLLLCLWAGY
jgi:hypothetical protein